MSTNVQLDLDQMIALGPVEGDRTNFATLSPFAIPESLSLDYSDSHALSGVRLHYSGGEQEMRPESLDEQTAPRVSVQTSEVTQKVVSMRFDSPVGANELRAVADRLERRVSSLPAIARRLSYRMTASVLRLIADNASLWR